ncbi:MAG: 50S ribosomal protein L18 [Nitrososphaerota archaeon]|nr:50S ribosomal protein L18 [Nitrososphaerota archaeon]MDG6922545.1 50S ribosomal protein L18 [Nitrososphaerota archaeon]
MTKNHYIHIFRRRREGKTDYRKRRGVIVGKAPFLSIRVTGRYVYAQIIRPTVSGDITMCSASSRDLSQFGWKGPSKNLPGAYLTGFYLGQLAQRKNVKSVIMYSGVGRYIHGSRIASLISGAKESGLDIAVDDESLPDAKRTKGAHISEFAKKLEAEDKEKYAKIFSKVISSGMNPADYPSNFEKVKLGISKGENN